MEEAKVLRFFICSFFFFKCLSGEVVRFASFNVQNYLSCDRIVNGEWRPNYPKPEIEKKSLRSVIRSVNPDILALQEMGEYAHFLELWNDLNNTGGPYFSYGEWKPNREEDEIRRLSVLSKYKPKKVKNFIDMPFNYFGNIQHSGRGLQELLFEINNQPIVVFNLHLKSMWTEREDDPQANIRREKEARCFRDLIRKRWNSGNGVNYLILGDFNDHKNSAPLKRFMTVNDTILSIQIPCIDSRGHFWTHYFKKQDSYSRFDYILASPKMFEKYIRNSAWIMDEDNAGIASDHRLIYADFKL